MRVQFAVERLSSLRGIHTRARLGANVREFAKANYDLKTVCLPRQLEWVERLTE